MELGPQSAGRATERLLLLLLLCAYGWLFVYLPKLNNPNELVRLYMARALAEGRGFSIGERVRLPDGRLADTGLVAAWGWVNDKALVCSEPGAQAPACAGRLYAVKAPGTSFLEVPVYLVQRAISRVVLHRDPTQHELVLPSRWAIVILPSVIFWLALRRFLLARGTDPQLALVTTLAGACGSLSLTYGQMAAGHQLCSWALGGGFLLAFWPRTEGRRASAGADVALGLLLALATCADYQTAPAALLVGLGFWLRERPGLWRLARVKLGALVPLVPTLWFHTAAFGAPWRTPYGFQENAGFARDFAPGFLGLSGPTFERIWGSLFSPTLGLFFWAPWTALALGCCVPLLRRGLAQLRAHAPLHEELPGTVAALGVLWFLVFQVDHQIWRAGWTVGPRYITPVVPLAALACALFLGRLPERARPYGLALLGGSGAAAIHATGLASSVGQGFPPEPYNPLVEVVLPLLQHGFAMRNPLQALGVPGLWSALPYFAALALAVLLCLRAPLRAGGPAAPKAALVGVVLFGLLVAGQWGARGETEPGNLGAARFLASQWEPALPPGAVPFR